MADKKLVDQIVAAAGFDPEKDRPWLEQLSDDQLAKFAVHCAPAVVSAAKAKEDPEDEVDGGADEDTEDANGKKKKPTVMGAPAKPGTVDEWLALAPSDDDRKTYVQMRDNREMYAQMSAEWNAENARLTKEIVAQSRSVFTEADLKGKSRAELVKLATATKPVDYSGQGIQAHDATTQSTDTSPRMPGIKIGA